MATKFKQGDHVIDRDGFRGTIAKVTEWEGSVWYDMRIWDGARKVGEAVRYDSDLSLDQSRQSNPTQARG